MSNTQILDEAADWIVRLQDDPENAAGRAEFAAWLCRSPEHVRAYLELSSTWSEAASVDLRETLSTQTLIEHARAETNVVELTPACGDESRDRVPTRRGWVRRVAIACTVLVTVIATSVVWQAQRYPSYAAAIGEQRSIALADGSVVELNARSRIRVRYSEDMRRIELLEGQALFRVASNAQRPFVVESDSVRVRALGTQFDVYRKPSGTMVTVLEGKVEVTSDAARLPSDGSAVDPARRATSPSVPSVQLIAGQQVTIADDRIPAPELADLAVATAWTQRQLVFEATRLADVAQDFNRYNYRQLIIDDVAAESVRISGVFSSTDPAALVRFLHEQPDLAVIETDAEIRVTRREPAGAR